MLGVRRLIGSRTGQNLLALYGVQVANYVLPLLMLPYLARVLGPGGWGLLAIVQSFAQYLSLLVEYGFVLSATREVARYREDRMRLKQILSGVLGAKLILALLALGVTAFFAELVPSLGEDRRLLWSGVFWGIALAFSPAWFFQGLERLRFVAALEVFSKSLAVITIFLLVRSPSDAWWVLFVQGVGSTLSSGVAMWLAWREVGFAWPSVASSLEALRSGWGLFFFRAAVSLYTVGNAFILGLFVSPQTVAYYAGAERLTKAFMGLLEPLNRVFFPRISHLVNHSPIQAGILAKRVVKAMGIGGGLLAGAVVFLAPWIVLLLLGPDFRESVPAMRVLALLLPLIALSNALGVQWMLALRLDRPFNAVILCAGLLNLGLALLLVPRWSYMGMAYAVVLVEVFVTIAIGSYLWLAGKSPWQMKEKKL